MFHLLFFFLPKAEFCTVIPVCDLPYFAYGQKNKPSRQTAYFHLLNWNLTYLFRPEAIIEQRKPMVAVDES